jgi:uncharacterized OB-fold protein
MTAPSDSTLPTPAPAVDVDTEAFWAATAEHRLLVPRCRECGLVFWYPRRLCPGCGADAVDLTEATGRGTLYSFTLQHRPTGAYAKSEPFVLALVELDEGPRIMTNVVTDSPATLEVGQPVEVVFHDTGEGPALYRFRPVAA